VTVRQLLVAILVPWPALAGADATQEWHFRVLLDGNPIGWHRYAIEDRNGNRSMRSQARFDVKFLFFQAYTYVHELRERWNGDCLTAIDARTEDNGKHSAVRGMQDGASFRVSNVQGNAELPACVMSFAYWNPAILTQTRLLNSQTGEYTPVRVEQLGAQTIDVRGERVRAWRYALHAPRYRIDVWYTDDRRWVQLETRTDGGRELRYLID